MENFETPKKTTVLNASINSKQPYLKGSGISPFVIDPKAILKGIAAGQIKSLIFNTDLVPVGNKRSTIVFEHQRVFEPYF